MAIRLYAHNLAAYNSAVTMLQENGKAAIIHPTGTGKSFIAFKLIEAHPECSFLWLSPSEYIFKTQKENLQKEAPELSLSKVQFYTYAKLSYLTDSELVQLERPDYIILDEYHRGGAPEWEKHLRRLLEACDGAKLLGLSATNIRYLDNRRDMAQELFDGCIASELSLGEAIAKKILPAPKYVMAIYRYDQELERYRKRVKRLGAGRRDEAQHILDNLKRTLENSEGLEAIFARHILRKDTRLIVFCSSLEHMRLMKREAKKWFSNIDPEMHSYCVYSDNPEAGDDFTSFKQDHSEHLKLLFCIDMLNEGIHVADLDGVIMLRPTISPIVYKQQLGRALSAGNNKTPLIFDIVNNFDGLYSVGAIGNEMAQALRLTANGTSDIWTETGFQLVDEVREARALFRQLDNALASGWEVQFRAAKEFFLQNGHLNVPKRYTTEDGLSLGMWLQTQRRVHSGTVPGTLSPAQVSRLESIGMIWENRLELAWERNFQEAQRFFQETGNLMVPAKYVTQTGANLGNWVANQRQAYKSGRLTTEQIQRLDGLQMVWSCNDEKWDAFYQEAERYYQSKGDLAVPSGYVTQSGIRLGAWLRTQSRLYAGDLQGAAPLTEQQIERLNAIGMVWGNRNEGQWMKSYRQAEAYYRKNGDLNVPMDYIAPDGTKLGRWVCGQRASRKKEQGDYPRRRVQLLDDIGMDWRMEDPWQYRFSLVQQYLNEHGDLNIPAKYKTPDGIWLGTWLYRQKQLMKSETQKLSPEQQAMLKSLMPRIASAGE